MVTNDYFLQRRSICDSRHKLAVLFFGNWDVEVAWEQDLTFFSSRRNVAACSASTPTIHERLVMEQTCLGENGVLTVFPPRISVRLGWLTAHLSRSSANKPSLSLFERKWSRISLPWLPSKSAACFVQPCPRGHWCLSGDFGRENCQDPGTGKLVLFLPKIP
jgi:hypothetical protein